MPAKANPSGGAAKAKGNAGKAIIKASVFLISAPPNMRVLVTDSSTMTPSGRIMHSASIFSSGAQANQAAISTPHIRQLLKYHIAVV
ncbi:hypothetical protein BGZ97_000555 [Linnemannia gamsii]|uniref:Uncharacterized protein n=1 Tax=Linnemannia gamsii TaxID=64522 RepID=A0A9P6UVT3_9FUNG|nr:hypothetical protein BGZ97_000555 [Linnemannia gamsii]